MRVPEHPTRIRSMRDARVRQLSARTPVLAGSLVRIAKHCGRAGCHCQTGDKHVGWYLTRPVNGKTQTTYVPQELVAEVQGWMAEHRRIKQLVAEISELNRALIRAHVTQRKRRGTRSQPSAGRWLRPSGTSGRVFSPWLDELPDTRFQPFVTYPRRFLVWWGLLLFLCKLGRLRQLDYQLRDRETCVLTNVNALAHSQQETLPVWGTLTHFLGHVGSAPLGRLRTRMVRQLIRNKVLDEARLRGAFVVVFDGTGHVAFRRRHCPHCLTQTHGELTYYYHEVLEAKLVTATGLALSIGSEFIDNRHFTQTPVAGREARKQDCELKAFARLAAQLKADFPQTRLCLAGDALFACGPVFQTCQEHGWHYVLTFKPGGLPAVWQDFQGLLTLCPGQVRRQTTPEGRELEYRWVNELSYVDDQGRPHTFNGIQCIQTEADQRRTFAWLTDWPVHAENVIALAEQGGRNRWKIENEGFNAQKNGGYELEHVYGAGEDLLKSFYFLLQMAHLILQLVEHGSLLRRTAAQYGQTVRGLYGSLRNLARRLLDCLRYRLIPADAFAPDPRIQIRLDSS